jgi:hypothetical protein
MGIIIKKKAFKSFFVENNTTFVKLKKTYIDTG